MTGILQFDSKHGVISIEVEESVAQAVGGQPLPPGFVAKGAVPMTAKGSGDVIAKASARFEEAMGTLKTYAASLQDLVMGLDLTPREVTVEIGLKMTGSAGFVIARAGAETEMKVTLTWQPASTGSA